MLSFLRRLFRKPKPELEMVPLHDFETGVRRLVPKAELGPEIILVSIEGESVPVYAEAGQLRQGEYRHSPFEGAEREAIESLVLDLREVYPLSYEKWEDGFRRDRNAAREIAGWVHTASILRVMSEAHDFSASEKQECFKVLVACLTGPRDSVVIRSNINLLPSETVEKVIKYFFEGGYGERS